MIAEVSTHGHIELDVRKFKVDNSFERKLSDADTRGDVMRILRILDANGKGTWNVRLPEEKRKLMTQELTGLFVSPESIVNVSIKFEFRLEKKMTLRKTEFLISMRLKEEVKDRKIKKIRAGDWNGHIIVMNDGNGLLEKMELFLKEHSI